MTNVTITTSTILVILYDANRLSGDTLREKFTADKLGVSDIIFVCVPAFSEAIRIISLYKRPASSL